MLETLRKPFLFLAIALMAIVMVIEAGAPKILDAVLNRVGGAADLGASAPGLGIHYLILIDGLVLLTLFLVTSPLLISHQLQGKIQGLVTLITALVILIGAIAMVFAALTNLIIMVSLLLAPIFGTIAYFAVYSDFPKAEAATVLSLVMALKLGFSGCLFMAQQRFIQNKGLVLIIITSLIATLLVSVLHAIVPGFLVSITDAIAAIIASILAILWAVFLVIGGVCSTLKLLKIR